MSVNNEHIKEEEMRRKNALLKEERKKLLKDKEIFCRYVDKFNKTPPAGWEPLLRAYKNEVITKIRSCANSDEHSRLLVADNFLTPAHTVLKKWVEIRAAKMKEEKEFKEVIKENSELLIDLIPYKLHVIKEEEWNEIKRKLKSAFERIDVMVTTRKLMGGSKTLHFLLPDLVPPMDGEYVQSYFNVKISAPWKQEPREFVRILGEVYSTCKNLELTTDDLNPQKWGWNTSVPKMIDNAIVGWGMAWKEHEKSVIRHLKQ